GAPFMNDFAVMSLSDLMTPAELIRKRIESFARLDLPVAIYNPASHRRHDLLEYAVEQFREHGGNLPGAIVRDAYRPGQFIQFFHLEEFPFSEVNMTTLVILGNSKTTLRGNRLYCLRGYREKYDVTQ
ncbi:MAG: hypothetical protein IJJ26_06750, partial [Victivallales bacterium]|nr:hypothetical protein [Victivallales bacterium]